MSLSSLIENLYLEAGKFANEAVTIIEKYTTKMNLLMFAIKIRE